MNWDFATKRPSFTRRKDDTAEPLTVKGLVRKTGEIGRLAESLPALPEPGEAVHLLMTGRYDLTAVLAVILQRRGPCERMRIATLSFNAKNVAELAGWLDQKQVGALTLLASHFHRENSTADWLAAVNELRSKRGVRLAAARNHAKVVTLDWASGSVPWSWKDPANLRSNANPANSLPLSTTPPIVCVSWSLDRRSRREARMRRRPDRPDTATAAPKKASKAEVTPNGVEEILLHSACRKAAGFARCPRVHAKAPRRGGTSSDLATVSVPCRPPTTSYPIPWPRTARSCSTCTLPAGGYCTPAVSKVATGGLPWPSSATRPCCIGSMNPRRFCRRRRRPKPTRTEAARWPGERAAAARAAAHADALLASESEATRLAAARTLLDACLRYREQGELAARVEQLEAVLKQRFRRQGQ